MRVRLARPCRRTVATALDSAVALVDVAHGTGVWVGSIRARSPRALRL